MNLTWILTVLGTTVGSAALPVGLILMWDRMSFLATVLSPWVSICFGLIVWFVVTKKRSGMINVHTTNIM